MTQKQRKKEDEKYPRSARRTLAKIDNKRFKPQYNGKEPITFEEYLANFKKDENGKSLAPRKLQKSPLLDKLKKKTKAKKKAAAKPKKAATKKTAAKKTTKTKKTEAK